MIRGGKEASMSVSKRSTDNSVVRWILPAGGLAMAALGAGVFWFGRAEKPKASAKAPVAIAQPAVAATTQKNLETVSLDGLADLIRKGQVSALGMAYQRSMEMPNRPEVTPPAPTTADIASWKRVMQATSESVGSFEPEARKIAMKMAGRMLVLLGRDNVAATWSDLLDPVRETLAKGTIDKECEVRAAAIDQVAVVWNWVPGRDIFTVERNTLAAWKGGMLQLVQPFLKDKEIPARLAAMRCLSTLPIDQAAAPALELMKDKEPFVRAEVIRYFALRSGMISDEQLLGLLYDDQQVVRGSAELALKARGLSEVQISLGKMIVSTDPTIRVSVIGKLDESVDVDAGVWLARLVEDSDASVRLRAVEAIAKRKVSGDLIRRLQVISEKDSSDAVRKSAEKVVRSQSTASNGTAQLPPLPSSAKSASATIRAN